MKKIKDLADGVRQEWGYIAGEIDGNFTEGQNDLQAEITARKQADTDLNSLITQKFAQLNEEGHVYAGLAWPNDEPGEPVNRVFYITGSPGTYTHFGNFSVPGGKTGFLLWNGSSWQIETIDNVGMNVESGGEVFNEYIWNKATGSKSHAEGSMTTANGDCSHAEGTATTAGGSASHAEGNMTNAKGNYSHAEGQSATATGGNAHAEGYQTQATGGNSHAEGKSTKATGDCSHAEGRGTIAEGDYSHAEGQNTVAGINGHAEGVNTEAGAQGHAEGNGSVAGDTSHAEGKNTQSTGNFSHSEGDGTVASGPQAHAEGYRTQATGRQGHAEGNQTQATGHYSHAEGMSTTASADNTHAEGYLSQAAGKYAHAEGHDSHAGGLASHAEGTLSEAAGENSHAEGYNTSASGNFSHAEGCQTIAGDTAHAEGYLCHAEGARSHAEGQSTTASSDSSHAEGYNTEASGRASHAEGHNTEASGNYSHAEGDGTKATNPNEHACGRYNVSEGGTTIFSIGIGTSDDDRKNAFEAHGDGRIFVNGIGGYTGKGTFGHQTLQEVVKKAVVQYYPAFDSVTLDSLADGESRPLSDLESTGLTEEDITGMATGDYLFLRDDAIERTYIVQSGSMESNAIVTFSYGQKGTNDYVAYKIESDGSNCTITKYTSANTLYFHDNSSHGEVFNDYENNEASGEYSHAEGHATIASGNYSHGEGRGTQTTNEAEHAEGRYNKSNTGSEDAQKTHHSVGIGTLDTDRKNAWEVMVNGDAYLYGVGGYDGANALDEDVKTVQKVISSLQEPTIPLIDQSQLDQLVGGDSALQTQLDAAGLTQQVVRGFVTGIYNRAILHYIDNKVFVVHGGEGNSTGNYVYELYMSYGLPGQAGYEAYHIAGNGNNAIVEKIIQ